MKFQKTAVSLLSASALVFSAAGAASAQEKAPAKPLHQVSDVKLMGIETVGEWNKTISTTGGEVTLDTVIYKHQSILTVTGYQEAQGARANVRYQIRERVNSSEIGPVLGYIDVTNLNGYFSRGFAANILTAGKTYVIQAINKTASPVALKGNAVVYFD
ncbi:hypothetical protein P9D57_02980 [Bacillus sonorensis]|uniref:hypothetical protein n=1 Tax=Bacillus sonorensis TaxID=119858 RepID=UPI002DB70327|nr:hypothetical protein [Bacillus sonorensis]MEC1437715.1 hypothetical protein [Bacillus sonorensis]